jgi:hypothetical protein
MSNRPRLNHPIGGVPNRADRASFHHGAATTREYRAATGDEQPIITINAAGPPNY